MGDRKVLSLLAATLHIIMWHQCKSTKIITDTSVASAEFPSSINAAVDMVEHPDSKDKLLALLRNDWIAEINLNPLNVTILSDGQGFENGDLLQSQFNTPTAIIKIAPKVYVIADRQNDCIRKLMWSDSPYVTCLDESLASCHEVANVRLLAKHPNKNILYAAGKEFTEIDLESNGYQEKNIDAVTKHVEQSSRLLSLTASPEDVSLIFTIFTESANTVTIISYDLTEEKAEEIFAASNTRDDFSGEFTISPVFNYSDSFNLMPFQTPTSFKLVGNHLIGITEHLSKVLFDFDLVDKIVQAVNFLEDVGPGVYVKDDFLYTFHRSTLFKYSLLSSCDQRYSQRPAHLSFAWLRTGSHGCFRIEDNQLGDSIPLVQSQHGCPHQTCYSNCQQHCKDNPKCVAFQCHTYTQECRLSSCAMVSDEYRPDLSCYRLADIAYA